MIRMNQQIAEQVGLQGVAKDPEFKELGRRTSIDQYRWRVAAIRL